MSWRNMLGLSINQHSLTPLQIFACVYLGCLRLFCKDKYKKAKYQSYSKNATPPKQQYREVHLLNKCLETEGERNMHKISFVYIFLIKLLTYSTYRRGERQQLFQERAQEAVFLHARFRKKRKCRKK